MTYDHIVLHGLLCCCRHGSIHAETCFDDLNVTFRVAEPSEALAPRAQLGPIRQLPTVLLCRCRFDVKQPTLYHLPQ